MESNSTLTIIVAGVSLTLVLVLLIVVVRQRRQMDKMREQSKPKYGFLGKPLYSFLAVGVLVAGFGVTYYASRTLPDIDVMADLNVEISLNTRIVSESEKGYLVEFSAVPTVDDVMWGTASETFDIFWTVTKDDESFSEFELELNKNNQGGFRRLLSSGRYDIRADVIFQGRRFSESKTFSL